MTRREKARTNTRLTLRMMKSSPFRVLYSSWTDPITDEIKNTYTMVTTKANKIMDIVHNHKHRMPITLKKQDEVAWLDQSVKMEDFAYPYEGNLIALKI